MYSSAAEVSESPVNRSDCESPRDGLANVQLQSDSDSNNNQYSMDSLICSGDFGHVVRLQSQRRLSDNEKYYLLKHHYIPNKEYNFPVHKFGDHNRRFQINWLEEFNGLTYSPTDDGGYCKFCVLFACSEQELGVLVKRPLINLKKAKEKLTEHFGLQGRESHQIAVERALSFCAVQENRAVGIDQQVNLRRAKLMAENKLKLGSIAATVIFCGRQGLALRGHRDDGPVQLNDSSNKGNFQALLKFRVDAGDKVLKDHLDTSSHNATYTSKETQNQMIVICGDIIRNKLLLKIRSAKYFSVIADEATDAANDEQLSISVRFLDNSKPHEKFLGFHECVSGVTGEAIANDIITQLTNWQLDPQLLRGQAFDGAGAMAGRSRGAASRIATLYPKAVYTHCAAHRLNLCVVKCCNIRDVSNMMNIADKIVRFFSNSPKRQLSLEKWIGDTLEGEKRKKLKELCRTRWVERHEAFEVFSDLYLPIICSLEAISRSTDWNRDSRSDAQSLLLALSQFQFLVTLQVTQNVLAYTKGLSVKLQGRYTDIARAYREVETVKNAMKSLRSNVNSFNARVYSEAKLMAQVVDIGESIPRIASRQQHRSNIAASGYQEYYCRNLTIPLLDHLIVKLDTRFDESSTNHIVEFMQLLPSAVQDVATLDKQQIKSILKFYCDDLPSLSCIDSELDLWQHKWKADSELASELSTPEKTLTHTDYDFFPNIHTLLCIMGTLPVTSCECECSISMLRLIKSPLRSTMGQERLNGLAMMCYHRDIDITPEEVVEEFARCHPRRMLLID